MSFRDWVFRIQDILKAIEKIEVFTQDLTLSEFKKNELIIDAVIRNIEIIGEASKNIPKVIRNQYPSIPWNEINGMRNVLVHEYFGVDIATVWHTAKRHLPVLKKHLKEISVT